MIENIYLSYSDLIWPAILALAWLSGELICKWAKFIPKVSIYMAAGCVFVNCHLCAFGTYDKYITVLSNIAVGLILFECGYRANLSWIRTNPWVGVTALIESLSTLIIIYLFVHYIIKIPFISSIILAAVLMSASPEISLKIVNSLKILDQVAERSLYLSTMNFITTIVVFVIIHSLTVKSGLQLHIIGGKVSNVLISIGLSIVCGIIFSVFIFKFIKITGGFIQNITITYSIAIILIVVVAEIGHFSFILSVLILGLVSRHLRVDVGTTEKNFGTLGELLGIIPFIVFGSMIAWSDVIIGFTIALVLIGIKIVIKTTCVAVFSFISGISWIKGTLIGVALTPVSIIFVFYIQMLNENINDYTHTIISAIWFLNIFSTFIAQQALAKKVFLNKVL